MKGVYKFLFSILFLITVEEVKAQKVSYKDFKFEQYQTSLVLEWTIESGSTCNGITIYSSLDGVNFEEVGSIEGVCGSKFDSQSYLFTDKEPVVNTVNYYRLKFGNSQYSAINSHFFNYVKPNMFKVRPNPSAGLVQLDLNKDQNYSYSISVVSLIGKKMYYEEGVKGDVFYLNLDYLDKGIYFIRLINENGFVMSEKVELL